VQELVERAVAKRMLSDVPLGALLSGGVDSSTNVALLTRLAGRSVRTFSVGFTGFGEADNFHDLPYARRVAAHFGCRHSEVLLSARECQEYLPQFAGQLDEPLGDPACLPMHFVCRLARSQGVTVVFVGEGSDETFGGYGDMAHLLAVHAGPWRRLRRLPRLLRRLLYHAYRLRGAPGGRVDVLRRAAWDEPLYWGLDVVFWDAEKPALLRPAVRAELAGRSAARVVGGYYEEIRRRRPQADFLQQISFVELCNRLPELLLMRVDKLSMAHSLEARAPFLDHELVSYTLSLPQGLKIAGGQTKCALKRAVAPLLPAEIVHRPKQGFRVPLPAWLRGELSAWAEHQLFASALYRRGLFNADYLRSLWHAHRAGAGDHSFDLWCLINLASWYDHWIEGPSHAL
jgi:asparagine synthase (glutamine-hydrolysing)